MTSEVTSATESFEEDAWDEIPVNDAPERADGVSPWLTTKVVLLAERSNKQDRALRKLGQNVERLVASDQRRAGAEAERARFEQGRLEWEAKKDSKGRALAWEAARLVVLLVLFKVLAATGISSTADSMRLFEHATETSNEALMRPVSAAITSTTSSVAWSRSEPLEGP